MCIFSCTHLLYSTHLLKTDTKLAVCILAGDNKRETWKTVKYPKWCQVSEIAGGREKGKEPWVGRKDRQKVESNKKKSFTINNILAFIHAQERETAGEWTGAKNTSRL